MATQNATVPQSMSEALDRMWTRFVVEIDNRLCVLETAAMALGKGNLADDQREAAHQAAHKLAGILGTFGLPRGTELARQSEHLLEHPLPAKSLADLTIWVTELRTLVESRTVRH